MPRRKSLLRPTSLSRQKERKKSVAMSTHSHTMSTHSHNRARIGAIFGSAQSDSIDAASGGDSPHGMRRSVIPGGHILSGPRKSIFGNTRKSVVVPTSGSSMSPRDDGSQDTPGSLKRALARVRTKGNMSSEVEAAGAAAGEPGAGSSPPHKSSPLVRFGADEYTPVMPIGNDSTQKGLNGRTGSGNWDLAFLTK